MASWTGVVPAGILAVPPDGGTTGATRTVAAGPALRYRLGVAREVPVSMWTWRRRAFGAVAVMVALAVLSGCSGGAPRLTKPAFIATWDGICQTFHDRLDQVGTSLPSSPTTENLPQFEQPIRQVESLLRQELAALEDVLPPKEDQATITSFMTDAGKVADVYEQLADAAHDDNLPAFQSAEDNFAPPATSAARTAKEYGLKVCGQ
jgi:hypothetical protein